jgi:hypothetical protein
MLGAIYRVVGLTFATPIPIVVTRVRVERGSNAAGETRRIFA